MTIKLLLTLLLVSFTGIFTLQSQPNWFPENAEWYYYPHCFGDPECGFTRYYTDGDTVINGLSASVVRLHYENSESQSGYPVESYYFRFFNDTVFLYSLSNGTWGMLYDLGAQPGDVWDLTETIDLQEPFVDETAVIQVDSVTTEMVGGVMRRFIHTSPVYDVNTGEGSSWEFHGPIVEGVGPTGMSSGLFGDYTVQLPAGWPPYFACFRVDGEIVVGSDIYPCGIVSGIEEKNNDVLGVFPNPTTSHIRLQLPTEFAFQADIRVYNSVGQTVAQIENFNTLDPLPMNYPPGLYIVEARNENKVARGKVVVE